MISRPTPSQAQPGVANARRFSGACKSKVSIARFARRIDVMRVGRLMIAARDPRLARFSCSILLPRYISTRSYMPNHKPVHFSAESQCFWKIGAGMWQCPIKHRYGCLHCYSWKKWDMLASKDSSGMKIRLCGPIRCVFGFVCDKNLAEECCKWEMNLYIGGWKRNQPRNRFVSFGLCVRARGLAA